MLISRRLWCVFASLAVFSGLAVAQSEVTPPAEQSASWLDAIWSLPVFHWLSGFGFPVVLAPDAQTATATPMPPCSVAPLPPITDERALAFESQSGPVVNLDGLTARTNLALARFARLVAARGGSLTLTSAYRPEPYQQHLRDVWYTWMDELKDNTEPACDDLKAQVAEEFTRHQLLTTQHPVVVSDHTLGIGFDAAVRLPVRAAKRGRQRQISLDRLARLAGMIRPDVRRDPVHFRLIRARG